MKDIVAVVGNSSIFLFKSINFNSKGYREIYLHCSQSSSTPLILSSIHFVQDLYLKILCIPVFHLHILHI